MLASRELLGGPGLDPGGQGVDRSDWSLLPLEWDGRRALALWEMVGTGSWGSSHSPRSQPEASPIHHPSPPQAKPPMLTDSGSTETLG